MFCRVGYDPAIGVPFGAPADEITEVARESGSDLISTTTHGRQGSDRLPAGSVSEEACGGLPYRSMLLANGTNGEVG